MAGTQQFGESYPLNQVVTLTDVATPGTYSLVTAPRNYPWRVDAMLISNGDSIPHTVWFRLTDQAGGHEIVGSIAVPAGSGYGAVAPVDAFGLLCPSYAQYLTFDTGEGWSYSIGESINTDKIVSIWAKGAYL